MLSVGTVLHGTYRVDGYLASGGFGNTYVVTNIQFGERYAIKEFFLKGVTERDQNATTISLSNQENAAIFEAQREKFKKEAVRLRKLSSPNIVCVHDLFEENGTAYYVMDFVDGENLRDLLARKGHPLDEATVWKLFEQVLNALEVVHGHSLFHLDLKPANLMLDRCGEVKLIDFGASKQMKPDSGATTSTAVSYTNGYAPREQMEQALDKFGPWTDFYALGATLYYLLTDHKPPLPSDIDDDMTEDKHEALAMPDTVSDGMRRLVLWLMATDRRKRPQSVAEIRRVLNNTNNTDSSSMAEGSDEVTIVLPNSSTTKDEADDSSSTANETDQPSSVTDENESIHHTDQEDDDEVDQNNSSKWKWILIVLAFAVIGFFGAKFFMGDGTTSSGQGVAPSDSVADSAVADSAIVKQEKTPSVVEKKPQVSPAHSSMDQDPAANYPTPKKQAPKRKKATPKKKAKESYYYEPPYRSSTTPSKHPTSGGSSESYGSGSGKNPSYGSSSHTSSKSKENTAGDSSW